MYINPFLVGIIFTILVEVVIIIISVIIANKKSKG